VDCLTRLGQVVLFSAAIPHQGGTHHVNEQWPDYWAALFERHAYTVVDAIRPRIWNDPDVEWWYAQNTLLFVHRDSRARVSAPAGAGPLAIVHPRSYLDAVGWTQRLLEAQEELARVVPPQDCFILVDQQQLQPVLGAGRRAVPFLERDGQYWGPPPDDGTAIAELERLRAAGARFVVFAWPALWWLEHYRGFRRHLERYRCTVQNDRLVAFDLRSGDTTESYAPGAQAEAPAQASEPKPARGRTRQEKPSAARASRRRSPAASRTRPEALSPPKPCERD
jgi:hypothetical protein